jgi:threonine/homoserine/homoserine lactone efflux protein
MVALLAGGMRHALANPARGRGAGAWLRRATGALFIGLGVRLAFASR